MPKLVELRPIEQKKWHGKKGQESFTRPKKFQVLVDSVTMRYATGLTAEDIKKLKAQGIKHDLSDHFDQDTPHPFWDSSTATIKMENFTQFFDIDQPLNYIKVQNMKASKLIANSPKEYEEGLWPEATHVIFDESEEEELLASKVELKNKAVLEAAKLTPERKLAVLMILGDKNYKEQSDSFRTVALDKIISNDPQEFLNTINMDKQEMADYALVLEALQKSVLRKDGHKILYHDSSLGGDEMSVALYLGKDENQDLKLQIMSQVN